MDCVAEERASKSRHVRREKDFKKREREREKEREMSTRQREDNDGGNEVKIDGD